MAFVDHVRRRRRHGPDKWMELDKKVEKKKKKTFEKRFFLFIFCVRRKNQFTNANI